MSDLISRSKAISVLKQLEEHSLSGKMYISNAIYLLENQSTSYDIDKILEVFDETYNNHLWFKGDEEFSITRNEVIEIIKKSKQCYKSDDVCKWKYTRDEKFIQNPHTKRMYSNEQSMKNIYCNTCGKKIKVVE